LSSTPHRNVILIISDQLRRFALGCYGDPNVHTPSIDALASNGVRFNAATSTYPVCVPYRFTLMTGEFAHTRFIPSIEWRMSPAERTLADEFNEAGYDTALFGKWHLYGGFGHLPGYNVVKASRTPIPRPFQGRWQRFSGFDICNDPFDTYYFNNDDPTPHRLAGYQTDGLFDMAIDFLREPGRSDKPFATVLSVEPPHPLFTAPDEYLDRWRDRDIVLRDNVDTDKQYNQRGPHSKSLLDDIRVYYAMVENLDHNVGRLTQTLREQGLLENTTIVLTADHGELLGSHGLQAKQRPWEESAGIPLIVSGAAARGNLGAAVDDPVCTEDLFPTLLGVAGLSPRDPKPGVNLAPIVAGESDGVDRDGVLMEFVAELRPGMPFHEETWRGIRTRRYKYTVLGDAHGGKPWQFFDLATDPYEMNNLVDDPAHVEEVARHHGLLRQRLADTYDHYVLAPAFGHAGLNEWDPEAVHQRRFG
jgi:arylsulfatase A-like enzyme